MYLAVCYKAATFCHFADSDGRKVVVGGSSDEAGNPQFFGVLPAIKRRRSDVRRVDGVTPTGGIERGTVGNKVQVGRGESGS